MENLICYPNVYVVTEKTGEKINSVPCQKINRGKYIIPNTFDPVTDKLLFCRKDHPHILVTPREEKSINIDTNSRILTLQPADILDDPIAVMAGYCDGDAIDSSILEELCNKNGIAFSSREPITLRLKNNTQIQQKLCWIWISSKDVQYLANEVIKKSSSWRLSIMQEDNPYYNYK